MQLLSKSVHRPRDRQVWNKAGLSIPHGDPVAVRLVLLGNSPNILNTLTAVAACAFSAGNPRPVGSRLDYD